VHHLVKCIIFTMSVRYIAVVICRDLCMSVISAYKTVVMLKSVSAAYHLCLMWQNDVICYEKLKYLRV